MSDHQNIEELFRSKLGEAELQASEGVWKGVQRQLRRNNFLRFNARKFNIWYLGILLVAGTMAGVLLIDVPQNTMEEALEGNTQSMEATESPVVPDTPGESAANSSKGEIEKTPSASSAFAKQSEAKVKNKETDSITSSALILTGKEEMKSPIPEEKQESLELLKPLLTQFTSSVREGCAPLQVEFTNSSVNFSTVLWSFGNGETSGELSPEYIFEEAGSYVVAMVAVGIEGDSGKYYEVIRVDPAPEAGFEMGEGFEVPNGSIGVEISNYSTGGFSYSWELLSAGGKKELGWTSNEYQPLLNSREIPEKARLIRLVVENEHACSDTAIAELSSFSGANRELLFPTVFRANNTGPTGGYYSQHEKRIDIFHPNYSEEPAEYQLKVYSKMGEVVFETRDIHQGWDGYYQQERSSGGVYMWMVEGSWQNGSSFTQRGDVTLLWQEWR